MIWIRKTKNEWRTYTDDDDNDITNWFMIVRTQMPTGVYGYTPYICVIPGQARERWKTALTQYPFKTYSSAETVCMIEYENLIA